MTLSVAAAAMTARTPDHAAIFAAASLLAIPPLPRTVPAPPATFSSASSTSTISSMSDASASWRGSAVNKPAVSVSISSSVGAQQMRDERGEPIVVAVADLVVGDGVVLVDDLAAHRDRATAAASPARASTAAVREVVRREQDLTGDDIVFREERAHAFEQARLADRRDRLQRADIGRTGFAIRVREVRRRSHPTSRAPHGARRRARRARSAASFTNAAVVELARRRASIDDVPTFDDRHTHSSESSYVSSISPMRTTSPSAAPARASACSTPMRCNFSCT